MQIAGELIATWTSTQGKNKLRGASYPLTYTFVRDLRSSKYNEFMKKKRTAAAAGKASKLGTLTHFRTGAAASKLAQATNKRKTVYLLTFTSSEPQSQEKTGMHDRNEQAQWVRTRAACIPW